MQNRNEYQQKPYLKRVFISLDQVLNTLLGGNPDMTISGRIGWRLVQQKASKSEIWLCRFLRVFEDEHCIKSIEIDEIRGGKIPKIDFKEDELIAHFSDANNHYLYDNSEDGLLLSKNDSTSLKEGGSYKIECSDLSFLTVEFGDTLVFNKKTKEISIRKENNE